jgi:hypothetical protein
MRQRFLILVAIALSSCSPGKPNASSSNATSSEDVGSQKSSNSEKSAAISSSLENNAIHKTSDVSESEKIISCNSDGRSPVTIALESKHALGRALSCISGDFIADLTPCAPDGAYALSAPTGDAAITEIVDRWQDYSTHDGGVTNFFSTPTEYRFEGGSNSSDGGYVTSWSFDLNRITGVGKLQVPSKPDQAYRCSASHAKM